MLQSKQLSTSLLSNSTPGTPPLEAIAEVSGSKKRIVSLHLHKLAYLPLVQSTMSLFLEIAVHQSKQLSI